MGRAVLLAASLVGLIAAVGASAGRQDSSAPIGSARGLVNWKPGSLVATMPPSTGTPHTTFLAVADFNGDGHPDILATHSQWHSRTLYTPVVFVNNGHGGFVDQTHEVFSGPPPLMMDPRRVLIADFNRDGRPDVFIGDQGPDEYLQGYHNTLIVSAPGGKLVDATGDLPPQVDTVQVDALHGAAVGDLNGDGAPDIFLGEMGGERDNGVLLNDGTGHFTREPNGGIPDVYHGGCSVILAAAIADLNGDGVNDLIVGGGTNPCQPVPTAVLLNDGHGHFPNLRMLPQPPYGFDTPTDIQVGDLNGDGAPDIVIGYSKQSFSGLWLQIDTSDGHGNFTDGTASLPPQSDNNIGGFFNWIRLVDLNGDGHLDIATGLETGAAHRSPYYLNDGTGHFTQLPDQLGFGPIDTNTIADAGDGNPLDLVYGGDPTIEIARAGPQPPGTLYATIGPDPYVSFINDEGGKVRTVKPGEHRVIVWDRSPARWLTLRGPRVSQTTQYSPGIEYWDIFLKPRAKYIVHATSPKQSFTFHTSKR